MKAPQAALTVVPRLDRRIERLFDTETARWSAVSTDLAVPVEVLRAYVMAGGKRLRPSFCYWSFIGAGGSPDDPAVIDAGAALELLHVSALVHDDVIDGSALRHGEQTVHERFAETHKLSGWFGDHARFGQGAAILVGDLALVYSSRLLAGAPPAALAVFEDMRLEVNMGQYLDVLGAAQGLDLPEGVAIERARQICRYKTAKYTIERPLHLGAALAAPDRIEELIEPLSRFGLPLGEAFQLRDDLLGVFGDPAVTGKPVGDDLREGKPTLLAALAVERDRWGGSSPLRKRFGQSDLTDPEIHQMQDIIEATGARSEVEQAISALVLRAKEALENLPLAPEAVSALGDLAAFVVERNH